MSSMSHVAIVPVGHSPARRTRAGGGMPAPFRRERGGRRTLVEHAHMSLLIA